MREGIGSAIVGVWVVLMAAGAGAGWIVDGAPSRWIGAVEAVEGCTAAWAPVAVASAECVTLDVAGGNLQLLVVTNAACTIYPPAVNTNLTQSIRLELVAGTNAITFAGAVSNAASLTIATDGTTALLFDQPYGRTFWKVYGL
jgi:hypothetical protein